MSIKDVEVRCPYCNKILKAKGANIGFFDWANFYQGYNKEMKHKLFCDEKCFNAYIEQFVECIYNNVKIYKIDEKYIPYWGSLYYFITLEECKNRIDAKNISVVPIFYNS